MKKNVRTFVLGILAGLAIGLGGALFTYIQRYGTSLLGGLFFSVGLLLVCSFSLNLFTGKIGYVFKKDKSFIKDLAIMYAGNFVGAVCFGYLLRLLGNDFLEYQGDRFITNKLINFGNEGKPWFNLLFSGMMCGILVYLAVEGFKKESLHPCVRLAILVACVTTFVTCGFEHCIADMFYFALDNIFFSKECFRAILSIIIITVGNSLGAILIDFLLNISSKEETHGNN